jgi:hypothetical protein
MAVTAYCDTIARNFGVPPPLDQHLPPSSRHGFRSVVARAMNLDCIEAIVSGQRIAVPVRAVERLAELEVRGPVPLAPLWVGPGGAARAFQCPEAWLAGTGDDTLVLIDTEAVWSGLGVGGSTAPVPA